jgi:hypothetical protein
MHESIVNATHDEKDYLHSEAASGLTLFMEVLSLRSISPSYLSKILSYSP